MAPDDGFLEPEYRPDEVELGLSNSRLHLLRMPSCVMANLHASRSYWCHRRAFDLVVRRCRNSYPEVRP